MINIAPIPNDIWAGLENLLRLHEITFAEFLDQLEETLSSPYRTLPVEQPHVARYCEAEGISPADWSWCEARRILRESGCLPPEPDDAQ